MFEFKKTAVAFLLSSIILLSFSGCANTQVNKPELQSSGQLEQSSQTTETSSEPTVSKMDDSTKSSVNQSSEKNQESSTKQTASNSNTSQVISENNSEPSSSLDQSDIESDVCFYVQPPEDQILALKQDKILEEMRHYIENLETKLNPDDYLGFKGGDYESGIIIIKVVNMDSVESIVKKYPSESFKVLYEKVDYSLSDLISIKQELMEQPFYKKNASSIHIFINGGGIIEYSIGTLKLEDKLEQWIEDCGYSNFFINHDKTPKTNPN